MRDWERYLEWEAMRDSIGSCDVMDSGMVVSLESLKTDIVYEFGDVVEDEVAYAEVFDVQLDVEAMLEQMYSKRHVNKKFGTLGLI